MTWRHFMAFGTNTAKKRMATVHTFRTMELLPYTGVMVRGYYQMTLKWISLYVVSILIVDIVK